MLAYLQGKVFKKETDYIILKVDNIGYQVFLSELMLSKLNIGDEIEIFTHQYVREDALDLYGFKTLDELNLFKLLISISGVGPKSALGIMSIANVGEICQSIEKGDVYLLTKVSGIGKKTAERIVLELREKISNTIKNFKSGNGEPASFLGEEIDALVGLGYSLSQARDALRNVDPQIKDSGERIRQALKNLGR